MHDFPRGAIVPSASLSSAALQECKRLAVERLGGVLAGIADPIEQALQRWALRDGVRYEHAEELLALTALRQRASSLVMRYRQQLAQTFDGFVPGARGARSGADLNLVAEEHLAFYFAQQRLAEGINARHVEALERLDARFALLGTALGSGAVANPVGGVRLAAAFVGCFDELEVPDSLQASLFDFYAVQLERVLDGLYRELEARLDQHGFRPAPVAAPVPAPFAAHEMVAPRMPAPTATHELPPDPAAQVAPWLLNTRFGNTLLTQPAMAARALADLQELTGMLRQWREDSGDVNAPVATSQDTRRRMRTEELVSIVGMSQCESPDEFADAMLRDVPDGLSGLIRERLRGAGRRLGIDPQSVSFSPEQDNAIDLVGMVFESLMRSHTLLERAHRLFARLVMPIVKVALTDQTVFTLEAHPARRLLDAITEACDDNQGTTAQERELLERAARAVHRVNADYTENLAVFELALGELEELLEQQRRRGELLERRTSDGVHGRERLLQARMQAHSALTKRLAGQSLSGPVAGFLAQHWQQHMVQVLLRDGFNSPRHASTLQLGQALVALDQLAAQPGRGDETANRLLSLQPVLVECLQTSGLSGSSANESLNDLVRAMAIVDTSRSPHAPPPLVRAEDEAEGGATLRLIGGTATLHYQPETAERMRRLMPGDWLRLVDDQGRDVAVKVAWISPLTSRLLLVNRRGVRVLVASPEQLAVLADDSRVIADVAKAPVDEAMRRVKRRLVAGSQRCA
jgi:hypothetical protein